jgi:hypothetical protein
VVLTVAEALAWYLIHPYDERNLYLYLYLTDLRCRLHAVRACSHQPCAWHGPCAHAQMRARVCGSARSVGVGCVRAYASSAPRARRRYSYRPLVRLVSR